MTDLSRGHFTALLAAMIVYLFVLLPVLQVFPIIHFLLDASFIFILGWSCYTISDSRRTFVRGITLAALAIVIGSISTVYTSSALRVLGLASSGMFSGFMALTILGRVLEQKKVTLDGIFGGVCAYLFFGLVWAFVYAIIDVADPAAFNFSSSLIDESDDSSFRPSGLFVYFSFVTLTTLGYGDISPLSEAARSLATLEAIMGPLYMAILIGWLVGRTQSSDTSGS